MKSTGTPEHSSGTTSHNHIKFFAMTIPVFFFLILTPVLPLLISCSTSNTLSQGSSISVEKPEDKLKSTNGVFSAGFYSVGDNAYAFCIWFSKPSCTNDCTIVWMANRDFPVNGRLSRLSLRKTGNLVLTDARKSIGWSTNTNSRSSTELNLGDDGNLVLRNREGVILWQSFDFPSDTLLPYQQLTREKKLVSSRSPTNFSSGFYKLQFDDYNVLTLHYDGPGGSSTYWPDQRKVNYGSLHYKSSRNASFDSLGNFTSSDGFSFLSLDHGERLQRRLTVDYDGNFRLYSRKEGCKNWAISWQAISMHCNIHGICGRYGLCSYSPEFGRKCSCLPGYKMRNGTDWSYGCEQKFSLSCPHDHHTDFLQIPHLDFWGNDLALHHNFTLEECRKKCLESCNCEGFQYSFHYDEGAFACYLKTLLLTGYRTPRFLGNFYVKIHKGIILPPDMWKAKGSGLNCSPLGGVHKVSPDTTLKLLLWFACAIGWVEVVGILLTWLFLKIRSHLDSSDPGQQRYLLATTFQRFTYSELKKATRNFEEELGRGAGGIVYKGRLSAGRVAAIKKLYVANQGEADFLAEISTIGRLNHINLIEVWGYCAEGKHRLLVYEYMEHGSLAENLSSESLDWEKRFEIAMGTARGLAYLHEECLEWVLHCDVKPKNILLDANYQPKVSDFGLSKLLNRDGINNSSFSRIRGTRGYMAPEWVFDLPITSKVDVYSYGVVVLEMMTGRGSVTSVNINSGGIEVEHGRVASWVRDKKNGIAGVGGENTSSWIEDIIDPMLRGDYDKAKTEFLVTLALQCVEEDKDARPSMSKVVAMLQQHEFHSSD